MINEPRSILSQSRRQATTYSGVHAALRRICGPAADYVCSCGKRAAQWAYSHDDPHQKFNEQGVAYSLDVDRYSPMCRRCHAQFDKKHITECPHGHKYTPRNTLIDAGKRKCRTCVYDRNNKRRKEIPMTAAQRRKRIDSQRKRRAAETPEQHRTILDRANQLRRTARCAKRVSNR